MDKVIPNIYKQHIQLNMKKKTSIRNGQKKKLGKCLTIWKLDSTLLNNSNLKRRNDKGKKKAF